MKLQGITSVNYNISEDLKDFHIDRVIREISEGVAPAVASWYILNESTNRYDINQLLVNEGVTDLIKKGIGKVNDAITKGYSDLDAIKTKVVSGLKGKADPGVLSKLGEIAKKNAKFIKPALMVAVIGASLLGMDTASAGEFINQVDGMDSEQLKQLTDTATVSDNAGAQGGDSAGENAAQAQGGGNDGQKSANNIADYLASQGAPREEVMKELSNMKINGVSGIEYLNNAQNLEDAEMDILKAIKQNMMQQADGGGQGGTTTTTTTSGTMQGDGKGGFVDQDGGAAKAPQRYDNATGKWVDSKVTRGR